MKKNFNLFSKMIEKPFILALVLMSFAVLSVLFLIIKDVVDNYPRDVELHRQCMEKCLIKQIPETVCSNSVCS